LSVYSQAYLNKVARQLNERPRRKILSQQAIGVLIGTALPWTLRIAKVNITAPHRGAYYLPSFEAAARSLKVEPITMPVHSRAEIEAGITSLGREPGGGFVAMGDPFILIDRKSTLLLATQNKVPAVYFHAVFPRDGGLLSYGPDNGDIFRRAAPYVDRVLRGANPAELPVQSPVKFELVINLKTAKALGLEAPWILQQRADEVIE
jgi:ABC-type uncharacterized transport system substrate-binding protein